MESFWYMDILLRIISALNLLPFQSTKVITPIGAEYEGMEFNENVRYYSMKMSHETKDIWHRYVVYPS